MSHRNFQSIPHILSIWTMCCRFSYRKWIIYHNLTSPRISSKLHVQLKIDPHLSITLIKISIQSQIFWCIWTMFCQLCYHKWIIYHKLTSTLIENTSAISGYKLWFFFRRSWFKYEQGFCALLAIPVYKLSSILHCNWNWIRRMGWLLKVQ